MTAGARICLSLLVLLSSVTTLVVLTSNVTLAARYASVLGASDI